jgi:protein O-mannosyl-transferase
MFSTPRQKKLLLSLILSAVTLLVYQPVKNFEFINYDDDEYVTENYIVQSGLNWKNVKWALGTTAVSNWHPLTWISHMLDCHLYGLDASKHHWMNLMWHIVNVLLLFYVLDLMTKRLWPSAIIAALFALHPLNIQSVAWIAERKNLLSTTFWFLGMWAYIRYVQSSSNQKALWYLFTTAFLILGLMAKPMVVTLPCVFLLLDYWPLGRLWNENNVEEPTSDNIEKRLFKLVLEKFPMFILVAASSVVTYIIQNQGGALLTVETMPVIERIKHSLVSYWIYIYKTVYPVNLSVYYPHYTSYTSYSKLLISGLILAAITAIVLQFGKTYRYLVVGWLWYLGTLVPVIGIIKAGDQAYADRYAYIPLIGLFIMAVLGGADLIKRWPFLKHWMLGSCAIILLALALDCRHQLQYWHNSIALFGHAVEVTENNKVALSNLGVALMDMGEYDQAMKPLEAALKLNPDFMANLNFAIVLIMKNRTDEAIEMLDRIIPYPPNDKMAAWAHFTMGEALVAKGKYEEAVIKFKEAIRFNPQYFQAYNNLGGVLFRLNRFDESKEYFLKSINVHPNANSYYNLALVSKAQDKAEEAKVYYQHAVILDTSFARFKDKFYN